MGKHDMADVSPTMEMYERELGEREHIVNSCPIDVYASSISPRWGYPNKLMSYWEARTTVRDSAEHIIIDSGFERYGDMKEILKAADRHDAEWIILPDITPHFFCYDDVEPVHRAQEFARHMNRYERKNLSTGVLLPLHRPVDECLDALLDPEVVKDARGPKKLRENDRSLLEEYRGVAVGLKGIPVEERIEILGKIRRRTPEGTHIHALSPGTELEMIAFLRENPHMLDSFDVSTPETASKNNKIPDNTWKQHKVPFPTGSDVTTLRAMRALEIVLRLNHMLSDLCDDSEFAEIRRSWTAQPAVAPTDDD